MLYVTYGPYSVETKSGTKGTSLNLTKDALDQFWEKVKSVSQIDLRSALGVYIFASNEKYNFLPWYVGQSKTGFEGEVFSLSNRVKYHEAYNHHMSTEKAVIFLIVRVTPKTRRLVKSLAPVEANFVEHEIIRLALAANPKLINSSNTAFFRKWEIRGIMNTDGEIKNLDPSTKRLRKCLSLKGNPLMFKSSEPAPDFA